MMISRAVTLSFVLVALLPVAYAQQALPAFEYPSAADGFVVADIRIEGLDRVSPSTAFATLPVTVGDRISPDVVATIIRRMYGTGYFEDVDVARDRSTLIVRVAERPFVDSIELDGNRSIADESLLSGLAGAGLSEGSPFRRATLDNIRRELERQYTAQGRYGASVVTEAEMLPRNRVGISITIEEGGVSRISSITFVGNGAFTDDQLREVMRMKEKSFGTVFNNRDRYSRQQMQTDLDAIREYYLNAGYLRVSFEDVDVALTPTHSDIHITITLSEGDIYTINKVDLIGEIPYQREQFLKATEVPAGTTFSQLLITGLEQSFTHALGDSGYAFADVTTMTEVNEEDLSVRVVLEVVPGPQAYVRRVNITGNQLTHDEVIRREMRQMEGSWASSSQIELSRLRIERTGHFDSVQVETVPVPGTDDRVDINVTVEEQLTGEFEAQIGYSSGYGASIGFRLAQRNFLGTGNEVDFTLNRDSIREVLSINYVDPYLTTDGISLGYQLAFSSTDYQQIYGVNYDTTSTTAGLQFGFPISETQRLGLNVYLQQQALTLVGSQPRSTFEFLFVDHEVGDLPLTILQPLRTIDGAPATAASVTLDVSQFHTQFFWTRRTLNRGIFPSAGSNFAVLFDVVLPSSDVTYYKIDLNYRKYWPLTASHNLVLAFRGRAAEVQEYGDTNSVPFFERYYTGGPSTVRGFRQGSLVPLSDQQCDLPYPGETTFPDDRVVDDTRIIGRCSANNTIAINRARDGGDQVVNLSLELVFPLTGKVGGDVPVRGMFFIDAGSAFRKECPEWNTETCRELSFGNLRQSAGFAIQWITAFGPLNFILARTLKSEDFDATRSFEFTIGASF